MPVIEPTQQVSDVRALLVGGRYDSASLVVVCRADRFIGVVTIEDLLSAAPDAAIESLMDPDAPVVAPGTLPDII